MDVFTQTQRVRSSLSILQSLRRDVSAYNRDVLPIDQDGIQRMVLVEVCRRNIDDAANATSLLRAMLDGAPGSDPASRSLCDEVDSAIVSLRRRLNTAICRPYCLDEV